MKKQVKCAVCKDSFAITVTSHRKKTYPGRTDTDSTEGTYFTELYKTRGKWFCNDCWKEIIDYYKHNIYK